MTMWLMAVVGLVRGDVDAVAIRLPSVIAVVLTSLLDLRLHARARLRIRRVRRRAGLCLDGPGAANRPDGRVGSRVRAAWSARRCSLWHLGYMRGWPTARDLVARLRLCRAGRAGEGPASAGLFRRDHRRLPRVSPRLALPHQLAIRGRRRRLRRHHRRLANSVLPGDRLAHGRRPPGPAWPPIAFTSPASPSTSSLIRSKHSPACCPGRRSSSRWSSAKRASCSPTSGRWCRSC